MKKLLSILIISCYLLSSFQIEIARLGHSLEHMIEWAGHKLEQPLTHHHKLAFHSHNLDQAPNSKNSSHKGPSHSKIWIHFLKQEKIDSKSEQEFPSVSIKQYKIDKHKGKKYSFRQRLLQAIPYLLPRNEENFPYRTQKPLLPPPRQND